MRATEAEVLSGSSGARVAFRGRRGRIVGRWNDPWGRGPSFMVIFDDRPGRWSRLYTYRVLRLVPQQGGEDGR